MNGNLYFSIDIRLNLLRCIINIHDVYTDTVYTYTTAAISIVNNNALTNISAGYRTVRVIVRKIRYKNNTNVASPTATETNHHSDNNTTRQFPGYMQSLPIVTATVVLSFNKLYRKYKLYNINP